MCKSWHFTNINSNTTTEVKLAPTVLHSITINKAGASSNTITVYNNITGTGSPVAVIDGTAAPQTLLYDISLSAGLRIVTATGTAADITVSWE